MGTHAVNGVEGAKLLAEEAEVAKFSIKQFEELVGDNNNPSPLSEFGRPNANSLVLVVSPVVAGLKNTGALLNRCNLVNSTSVLLLSNFA